MQYVTLGISFVALAFSLFEFISNGIINRKERTLNAFAALQQTVLDEGVLSDENIAIISTRLGSGTDLNDESWREISHAMAQIERFAVGINSGVYDIRILNRMAGSYMIRKYASLLAIIYHKRKTGAFGKHYDEYDRMVRNLAKRRKDKDEIALAYDELVRMSMGL